MAENKEREVLKGIKFYPFEDHLSFLSPNLTKDLNRMPNGSDLILLEEKIRLFDVMGKIIALTDTHKSPPENSIYPMKIAPRRVIQEDGKEILVESPIELEVVFYPQNMDQYNRLFDYYFGLEVSSHFQEGLWKPGGLRLPLVGNEDNKKVKKRLKKRREAEAYCYVWENEKEEYMPPTYYPMDLSYMRHLPLVLREFDDNIDDEPEIEFDPSPSTEPKKPLVLV